MINPSQESKTDPNSAEITAVHARTIAGKPCLRDIYLDHYRFFLRRSRGLPVGKLIELGSGGGFIKEVISSVITSDVVALPGIDIICDACSMPFADSSVACFLMIDVFHHIQRVRSFLTECARCLVPGGKVLMIEPANTLFGGFIYRNFHHEPFNPKSKQWELPDCGRLTAANGALPWIVFCRDQLKYQHQFPMLRIEQIEAIHPFRYLLSGGVSHRQFIPTGFFPLVYRLEELLAPWNRYLGLFYRIELLKIDSEEFR